MEDAQPETAEELDESIADPSKNPIHDRCAGCQPDVAWHRKNAGELLAGALRFRSVDASLERGVQRLQPLVRVGEIGRIHAQVTENFRLAGSGRGGEDLERLADRRRVA